MALAFRIIPGLEWEPFTLQQALDAGLSRRQLQGPGWRRIGHGIYICGAARVDELVLLAGALLRLPEGAVFCGQTGGWLHGLALPPCNPIEVALDYDQPVAQRAGVRVHRTTIRPEDIVLRRGLPVMSPLRTAADLGRWLPLVPAVVGLDAALHAGLAGPLELDEYARARPGASGIARLRRALELAEPRTESPMETRLRLRLVLGGLPRPEAQVDLHEASGEFIGRPDLLYREARIAIEYDGGTHRDSLVADNRRQNRLMAAGYQVLRFTGPDLRERGDRVVMEVRAALAGATSRKGPR